MIESEVTFFERCRKVGLSDAQVERMKTLQLKTFSIFAFCCAYQPGAVDDAPLKAVVRDILNGADPSASQMSMFRRIYYESFTLAAGELRDRQQRAEGAPPKALPTVERNHRYNELSTRLVGLVIVGEVEPSDWLVDECVAMYDANRVRWLAWSSCTKRDAELAGAKKVQSSEFKLQRDATGAIKATEMEKEMIADTSSDLLVRYALQRRAIAFDLAMLAKYESCEAWHDLLFRARLQQQPPGYKQISLVQLELADEALHCAMSRATRSGIQINQAGLRPLEQAMADAMKDYSVLMQLNPLQGSSSSTPKRPPDAPTGGKAQPTPPDPNSKRQKRLAASASKGKGKGKSKGKEKGKGKGGIPEALEGGVSRLPDGRSICFGFNLLTCQEKGKACYRGLHVCCKKDCGGEHAFLNCPKP